ncbi:cytochrome P450 [Nocardia sp. NPDC050175]|uniref:cytochrome P450 n=1 Tax=Nocardia sp. NPDC050175 TaxID=3364317 RepID=UPI00378866AF
MLDGRTIPTAPGALPLVGHAIPLLRNPLAFLATLPRYGNLVRIGVGPYRMLVLCDADLAREVLVDDRTFDKGGLLVERGREVVGDGVGTCPHGEHRSQRRLTQPAFGRGRFPGYAAVMAAKAETMADRWTDGAVIDVLAEMLRMTCATVAHTMVSGNALDEQTRGQIIDDLAVVLQNIYRRMFIPPPLDRVPTRGKLRYDRARTRLRGTLAELIADYRNDGVDHGDMLSMLIRSSDEDRTLTDDQVHDQIVTLFLAGTESTAAVLAWCWHTLGQRPDLEKRLWDEVDAIPANRLPVWEDMPNLVFANDLATESLRMYPPGWLFTRVTTERTMLAGYAIPKGATVAYSPHLMQNSELYAEPAQFDPDRWSPERASELPRNGFLAFGGGARKCLGDVFALTEATLTLTVIARRWQLRPITDRPVRTIVDTTLRPRGLEMRVEAR